MASNYPQKDPPENIEKFTGGMPPEHILSTNHGNDLQCTVCFHCGHFTDTPEKDEHKIAFINKHYPKGTCLKETK